MRMPRKPKYIEHRDKTDGGYVLIQIDEEVFNRTGRPIMFFLPKIKCPRLTYTIQTFATTADNNTNHGSQEEFWNNLQFTGMFEIKRRIRRTIMSILKFWRNR